MTKINLQRTATVTSKTGMNGVEVFLRPTRSGSIDVVAKGNGKQARIVRILGSKNKAAKVGCLTFGRKASSLRALGFQVGPRGRVAFSAR